MHLKLLGCTQQIKLMDTIMLNNISVTDINHIIINYKKYIFFTIVYYYEPF